jgi:hypothetical protein
MDAYTFDELTARLARRPNRRGTLRLLGGGILAGLLGYRGAVSASALQRLDSDGDGLYDDDESFIYGTDPFGYDSDGDAVGDGEEVYYGTNPLIGDQVVLEEPPADPVVVVDGGTVGDGGCSSVDAAGNCNGGVAVVDIRDYCRAEGASCTSDTDCCNTGTVLCCFDGTTLTTRCTDVTVYGGACL